MPERRVATLADAQRQVYWRRGIGWLLIGLSIIFLLLFFVKHVYINLSYSLFAAAWGAKLRHSIDLLLKDWAVLDLLWRAPYDVDARYRHKHGTFLDRVYGACQRNV